MRIEYEISECTGYLNKQSQTLHEMEMTAWLLKSDAGRAIGFVRPGTVEHKKMTDGDTNEPGV